MRWIAFLILVTLATAGFTALQEVREVNPQDLQLRQLRWQKNVLLAMADSMPEQHYRDKVTPEQRDFAQQLFHAALYPPLICARVFGGWEFTPPDTAAVLNSRAGLKGFVTEGFDRCIETIQSMSDEERGALARGFEGDQVPRSETLDQTYLHTAYTVGQVVANFRKHGMAPPEFPFF